MKKLYLDRESVLTITALDKPTFYGKAVEFKDEEARAMLWLEGLADDLQEYLIPLVTGHVRAAQFPQSLIKAYRSATRGTKKKATSSKEKA